MSATPSGYDAVRILEQDGTARTATRSQYEAIPLANRIALVLRNQVEFYRKGARVSSFEALKVS